MRSTFYATLLILACVVTTTEALQLSTQTTVPTYATDGHDEGKPINKSTKSSTDTRKTHESGTITKMNEPDMNVEVDDDEPEPKSNVLYEDDFIKGNKEFTKKEHAIRRIKQLKKELAELTPKKKDKRGIVKIL